MQSQMDRVAHGWALLAVRMPDIRTLSHERRSISELCESYSLAVLHLRELRRLCASKASIDEYEQLIADIEEEAGYYLRMHARSSA